MSNYRHGRLNEEISKSLSKIMRNVKDPRIADVVISISGVDTAPDLSSAKVYYSYLGSRERKDVKQGLKSAAGFIRSALAADLDLRHTPELLFIYDDSFENGARIAGLLKKVGEELRESEKRVSEGGSGEERKGEDE